MAEETKAQRVISQGHKTKRKIQTKDSLASEYMILFTSLNCLITGEMSNSDSPGNLELRNTTEINGWKLKEVFQKERNSRGTCITSLSFPTNIEQTQPGATFTHMLSQIGRDGHARSTPTPHKLYPKIQKQTLTQCFVLKLA